jgi:KDO2-lipid IV(A) lauroyltransferase
MIDSPIVPAVAVRTGPVHVRVLFENVIQPVREERQEMPVLTLTAGINRAFEPWVLEYAEQYNWLHPRWRNRPDGRRWPNDVKEDELYESRTAPFLDVPERVRRLISL